jgi:hypothetical protein
MIVIFSWDNENRKKCIECSEIDKMYECFDFDISNDRDTRSDENRNIDRKTDY